MKKYFHNLGPTKGIDYLKTSYYIMIYFLYRSYVPNTASTNRALAYFRNLEKLKIPITVVYFLPDNTKSKITQEFQYVKVQYYWDNYYVNHPLMQFISYYLYLTHFKYQLKNGDKVYVYGWSEICKRIIKTKGIDVYFEVTECPEVSLPSSPIYKMSLSEHFYICKQVTKLFVISNRLKEYYISKGIDGGKINVINMTVDTTRFMGIKKEKTTEKYIAYCGTVTNDKDGVDDLIRAFALVKKKYKSIKLYVIGKTSKEDSACNNLKLIKHLGLEDSIIFTGIISAQQMPQMLKNAEVLALARPNNLQARYGFPTKLGEYLLTANPVVVTSVGDIPSFLQDGVNALIVPPNNPNAFADKLLWVFDNQDKALRIGEKGQLVALEAFNAFLETKKLMNIIINK